MSETEPQFKALPIAVVVPVHNGAAFLQQCLASLLRRPLAISPVLWWMTVPPMKAPSLPPRGKAGTPGLL